MPVTHLSNPTFFFTARAAQRGSDVFVREIHALRQAMRQTRNKHPFDIAEIVVLGDVIHTLWDLPAGDTDFAIRWRMLKTLFSRSVEKGVWQRRFWEHEIRDPADLAAHRRMIWAAPVQAGLAKRPEDWPHSSVHRAMSLGQYDTSGARQASQATMPMRKPSVAAQLRAVS
ncbi:transposase [uncultured Tateyamaria sp.]|uniref:REP-associated tyrosine transposase n=1 Tax=uncultured Tateyamaria sp. TaxID=455651 RepID=UPI00262D2C1A|nr:transposase [uncultured Tateyamaria sp.]